MTDVRALGWSITANLGGDRQIVLQSFLEADMTPAQKNEILDEAMRLVDRQKAAAERPDVVKDLRKHRDTLAQMDEDQARLDADFPLKLEGIKARIADLKDDAAHQARLAEHLKGPEAEWTRLKEARTSIYNAGLNEHLAAGRTGGYTPKGHRATDLQRLDRAIEQGKEALAGEIEAFERKRHQDIEAAEAEIVKLTNERDVALQHTEISRKRYKEAIAALEERLAEIDKLLED